MRRRSSRKVLAVTSLLLAMLATTARAQDQGGDPLALSLGLEEEQVSASRFPRPISKIAENVTVVTARDIARLNAHTLAEVLQTVPGIQLDQLQTPGGYTSFTMLSMTSQHILVQLDGVPLNFLSLENLAHIGSIPVQMIERVEIVKGAASAAWGPALGGVINIVTKGPAADRTAGGIVSGSYAERSTSDLRAELTGKRGGFGYYLTGGNIHSDGLAPGSRTNLNHLFSKLSLELPRKGSLTWGVDFRDNTFMLERDDDIQLNPVLRGFQGTGDVRYLNSYLALRYPLAGRLTLELNGRAGGRGLDNERRALVPELQLMDGKVREKHYGLGGGLTWGDAERNLSGGIEYDRNHLRQREPVGQAPETNFDLALERVGGYLNGTYTLGPLSILPGVRYDRTSHLDEAFSYTLGMNVSLTESTTLRAYAARGYSMPMFNNMQVVNGPRQLQHVFTVQTGVESSAIPYLWLKGTLFYNNVWDVQTFDPALRAIVLRDQIREGVELEFRSSPVYGLALTGGYTYTYAWDKETREKLTSAYVGPRQGAKLALNYDDEELGVTGALTGNYVDWHEPGSPVRDTAVIWDLHLNQKLFAGDDLSPELFFSVRNIFNGAQSILPLHSNNPRWFEGGVRYRF